MTIIVRRAFPCGCLPNDLSGFTIDRDDFEGVFLIGADTVRMEKLFAIVAGMLHRFSARHHGSFNCRRQEHTIAPDDRRRMRATVDCSLPLDVLRRSPFSRKVFLIRDSGAVWPTPLRPIPCGCLTWVC